MIQAFGAPNGLCSSITELKHIKVVKKPAIQSLPSFGSDAIDQPMPR